jgi:hypothetical protein
MNRVRAASVAAALTSVAAVAALAAMSVSQTGSTASPVVFDAPPAVVPMRHPDLSEVTGVPTSTVSQQLASPWPTGNPGSASAGGASSASPCNCTPGDPLCSCLSPPHAPIRPPPGAHAGGGGGAPAARVAPAVGPRPSAAIAPTVEAAQTEEPHEDYLAFNPRQPMRLYEEDTVVVAAGRSPTLVQQKATEGNLPPPQSGKFLHSGGVASAELAGDGFQIVEADKNATLQDIDEPSEPGVWRWFVTPQKPGSHVLILSFCFHVSEDGHDPPRCDESEQRTIQVVVTGALPAMKYVVTEYTWLATLVPVGMAGTVGTWVWSRVTARKRKRGRGTPATQGDPVADTGPDQVADDVSG